MRHILRTNLSTILKACFPFDDLLGDIGPVLIELLAWSSEFLRKIKSRKAMNDRKDNLDSIKEIVMISTFKNLTLVNGTIVKSVTSEDLDLKEIVPIKVI